MPNRSENEFADEGQLAELEDEVRARDEERVLKTGKAREELEAARNKNAITAIELAERRRKVVLLEDVRRAAASIVGEINTRLLSLPSRLAPRVSRAKSAAAAKKILTEEVRTLMSDLERVDAEKLAKKSLEGEILNGEEVAPKTSGKKRGRPRKAE